ncbi:MAG TPA: efflux RND transporter periplasmic adaptor subunit [Pirellulales bacterium]|nr:efflux RND transporter periplasmic adaptor subunit [Pirellulales bacterium]
MNDSFIHRSVRRAARALGPALGLLAALAAPGCGHQHKAEVKSVSDPPAVQVMRPETRDIVRIVGQPSFVEAYERTSIYPKLTAYIQKWNVDIGDKVTRDQVLADLFVPEIVEDWKQKGATVEYDKKRVKLAEKTLLVAKADVEVAMALVKAAKATWAQYTSEAVRWESEVKRLRAEVGRGVVDPQVLLESENRLRGCVAARQAAEADIVKAESDLQSKRATVGQDEVAVRVAQADVEVADSDYKRLGAWADCGPGQKPYIKLYSPFNGVIVARNANTWDFVLPATGDPSADEHAPYQSPSGQGSPIYVVDRTDVVRIFVDIPEHDANFVDVGSKASVLIKAFREQPILGTVTRTSWALNVNSRTLRAEIDLPNTGSPIPDDLPQVVRDALTRVKLPDTDSQILPGMYAYGKVIIERPKVRALPVAALAYAGEKTFCWIHENGKAVRIEVQTGVKDGKGKWVEVINRRRRTAAETGIHNASFNAPAEVTQNQRPAMHDDADWLPFDGSEQVILGDLSVLTDGEPVHVVAGSGESKAAGADPHGI